MKLASRHVFLLFCDGALVLVLMRSHTHTSCAPFMHSSASPLTTLPLSPSVVGLLSQTSTFRPFFLATSTYFGFYFQCFPVFCLFVRKPRPQNFTLKNWKKNPPFLQKKKRYFLPNDVIHPGSDGSSFGCSLLSVCESVCCLFISETFHHLKPKAKRS